MSYFVVIVVLIQFKIVQFVLISIDLQFVWTDLHTYFFQVVTITRIACIKSKVI